MSRPRVVAAIGAGILAVPMVALVATAMFGGFDAEPELDAAADQEIVAPTTPLQVADSTDMSVALDPSADLEAACGPDAAALLAREAEGVASELETGALAALRPICAEAGLPLPDAPAQGQVIEEVVVIDVPAESIPASLVTAGHDDDHDEDDHDEDDHDEDDHDEDDHDEDDD